MGTEAKYIYTTRSVDCGRSRDSRSSLLRQALPNARRLRFQRPRDWKGPNGGRFVDGICVQADRGARGQKRVQSRTVLVRTVLVDGHTRLALNRSRSWTRARC